MSPAPHDDEDPQDELDARAEFAPEIIVLRQLERVLVRLSQGKDPYLPFMALRSYIEALGRDDVQFRHDMKTVDDQVARLLCARKTLPRSAYVERYLVPYQSLLMRMRILRPHRDDRRPGGW